MRRLYFILISTLFLLLISACGTGGAFRAHHVTNVELAEPNFKIVARDVQGSSMQGYLVGLSYTVSGDVGTFALIKVSGVDKLYDAAVKELWANYREEYGNPEGKKLALINIRQDSEVLNTLVYTQAKIFITADVIEFVE
jgi:hypothetical protein